MSLFWSATWVGLVPFSLHISKVQKPGGWPCPGIGEPIGSQMPTSMANHCRSKSPQLTVELVYLQILCHPTGHLDRLSPAVYSSHKWLLTWRIVDWNWLRRACYFIEAARHDSLGNPWTQGNYSSTYGLYDPWKLQWFMDAHVINSNIVC